MNKGKHLEERLYNMRTEDIYHYYNEKEYGGAYMESPNVEQLKTWYYYEKGRSKTSEASMDDISS